MIFLGIDCGTQSTKTIALDWENGSVLASARKKYDLLPGLPDGAMEQDPRDWAKAAEETVEAVLAQLGERKNEVAGIGVSGQQHGLVLLDARGEVVRPAKLWSDTSTIEECAEITAHFGGEWEVISRVGNAMLAGYTAPKILWVRRHEPENWKRTRTVLLPHDYLNFFLGGIFRMEPGDASGTAFFDIRTRNWNREVCDFIAPDLVEKLPPLGPSEEPVGMLRPELVQKWGLREDVLISAGSGDNMMSAIGTGNVCLGTMTVSLGTSGTLFAFSEKPVVDERGEVAGFCDSTGHWLPLVCTMNVTLVTELARGLFDLSHEKFDEKVESVPPGADGLLMLPYLTGERTPNLPRASGVMHGLTERNFTQAHLARAAMEGVTLGLGYGLKRFWDLGIKPSEIRLTGGGGQSKAWRQICADIFGVPVVCLQNGESAALGAAIQVGWTHGIRTGRGETDLRSITQRLVQADETTRAEPRRENTDVYEELLEQGQRLRVALTGADLL